MIRHIFLAGLVALLASAAQASTVPNNVGDESDRAVRLEIAVPKTQATTFWGRMRGWLGVRAPAPSRPVVGTKFVVQSSAYASSPYQTDATPCITAAGTPVRPGVVASNFLPIGTLLEIQGEEYIVEDRMNPRYSGHFIDLWFTSTSAALEFGRKNIEVTVTGYTEPGAPIRESKEEAIDVKPVVQESRWQRLVDSFGSFIGTRVAPDVNRFDIDCLSEGQGAG